MKKTLASRSTAKRLITIKSKRDIVSTESFMLKVPNFHRVSDAVQKKKRIVKYGSHCLKRSFHLWLHHSFIWFLICWFAIFREAIIVFLFILKVLFQRFSPQAAYGFSWLEVQRSKKCQKPPKIELLAFQLACNDTQLRSDRETI